MAPSHPRKHPFRSVMSVAFVLFVLLTAVSEIFLQAIKEHIQARNETALQVVLETTHRAVDTWMEQEKHAAEIWAKHPAVISQITALLADERTPEALASAEVQATLRRILKPVLQTSGYRGFFVIDNHNNSLASTRDQNLGTTNLLTRQPDVLARARGGHSTLSRPMKSDVPLAGSGSESISMFSAAPVHDDSGQVIAILAFRIDPAAHFTELLRRGRIGQTGETYAFSRDGTMLSESRFTDQLEQSGLLGPGQLALLNIQLRDPGADITRGEPPLPADQRFLTRMAAAAVAGESGTDMEGYRDYRGVPVVGAWVWLEEVGLGLTTEQDLAESENLFVQICKAARFAQLSTSVLLLALSIAVGLGRKRSWEANATLEARVEERTREARRASRARADFLARMSHEIRTPLHAIKSLLKLSASAPLETIRRDLIPRQQDATNLLMSIVNEILDFSKLDAGQLVLEEVPFSLEQLLSILPSLKSSTRHQNIALTVDLDERLPPRLLGDPTRLQQVLINLVGNALKFTQEGAVTVTCRQVQADGDSVTVGFSVADTGIGFEPAQAEKLFEVFTQADETTTRRFGGSGLGLAICKGLVERMGGTIHAEGRPGEGATFSFELRLQQAAPESKPDALTPCGWPELEGARLLLVEDNAVNRYIATRFLETVGAHVTHAENGEVALELLRSDSFDVVLMDGQMPVMDGWTATRHIREELKLSLPIIAVTADVLAESKERCLEVGMNDFISKPFEPDELCQMIVRHIVQPHRKCVHRASGLPT